jgi:heptosyltransferase I
VLDFQVYFKAGIVTSFTQAPVKLGFDRTRARDLNWIFTTDRLPPHAPQHVQDQYLEFLTALGVPNEEIVWNLGPWPEEQEWQRQFFERLDRPAAAIVVATSKPQKDWLPEAGPTLRTFSIMTSDSSRCCRCANGTRARRARHHGSRAT